MVHLKFTRKSARLPIGFLAGAGCAALMLGASLSTSADDSKPAGARGTTNTDVPQTARAEAPAANTTGSAQDLPVPPIDEKHPLYLPLVEAYKARAALEDVKDYEAEFTKRELIGRRLVKTTMAMKVREKPFSVYLKFLDAHAGREVIYVEGQNQNNIVVHEVGIRSIVGTLTLPPTGPDAMTDNKYPVTMIGMRTLIDKIIKQWETEGKLGEVKTQKYPNAKLPSGEECVAYESLHPTPRNQFPFHITRLWIEKKTGLPIRVEQLGFPTKSSKSPPIVEEYTYGKIKTNVPLGDRDFDPKNPRYAFP